jgi:hypothetical protein
METVPNREKLSLLGKGKLLVSCPRNRRHMLAETMLGRETETWSGGVEVSPPSNVNIRVKVITNPGRSFAAANGFGGALFGAKPLVGAMPLLIARCLKSRRLGESLK